MPLPQKIKQVMQQTKCSAAEAAEALGMDIDAAMLAEWAEGEQVLTLEKILSEGKIKAAKVLVDIIEDPLAENKDKIAAAKIVILGAGELPLIGANSYEERMKKFAELAESYKEKNANVIDVEEVNGNKMAVAV